MHIFASACEGTQSELRVFEREQTSRIWKEGKEKEKVSTAERRGVAHCMHGTCSGVFMLGSQFAQGGEGNTRSKVRTTQPSI